MADVDTKPIGAAFEYVKAWEMREHYGKITFGNALAEAVDDIEGKKFNPMFSDSGEKVSQIDRINNLILKLAETVASVAKAAGEQAAE